MVDGRVRRAAPRRARSARVTALVLLATDPGGRAAVRAAPEVWTRLLDDSGSPREQAARLVTLLFPPELAPQIDRDFGDDIAAARARLDPSVLRAQAAAMAAWYTDEPQPHDHHDLPVLAACGTEDIVIPPTNVDRLAARWPGCTVERFAGGGHAFMAQEPERLASSMASFLR